MLIWVHSWAFWNFKVEKDAPVGWLNGTQTIGGVVRVSQTVLTSRKAHTLQDYVQSVNSGFLHPDATRVFNKRVCDKYRNSGTKMKRAGAVDL